MRVALLLLAWVLVGLTRLHLGTPWNHIAILLIFFGTGMALMHGLPRFSLKPQGRLGAWVCYGYLLILIAAHIVLGKAALFKETLAGLLQTEFFTSQLLLLGTCVPIYEELFFRGALLERMKAHVQNPGLLIYSNALVFWLFHAPLSASAWTEALQHSALPFGPGPFLLGLVCASLAYADKSLFWAFIFHGLANSLGPLWANILTNETIFNLFYSRP